MPRSCIRSNLLLDHLLAVLGVLHRFAIQVQVFGIDGLLVEQLVEFGTQVFHPVVPLRTRTMVAHCLDIDHAADVGRASAVVLPTNDLPFVVDDEGAPAKCIDGSSLPPARDNRYPCWVQRCTCCCRAPAPGSEFQTSRCQLRGEDRKRDRRLPRRSWRGHVRFRDRSLVRHHDAQTANFGIDNGPEGIEVAAILFDPPIIDIVRTDGMFDRKKGETL